MAADKGDSYSGSSSYKYIDRLIRDEPELMIISPYIGNSYAKRLMKAASTKRIRVITSESAINGGGKFLKGFVYHNISRHIKAIAFLLLLDAISIYLGFAFTTTVLSIFVIAIVIATCIKYKKTSSNLQVKVPKDRFVHEKLYIGLKQAITGSANLTFSGTHRNVEHIELTTEESKIRAFRGHFESLWRGCGNYNY